jgi:penicillin amidase
MLDFVHRYQDDVMPFVVSDEEMGLAAADAERPPLVLSSVLPRGTNSWVISGELTDTGKPILAADDHLGIDIPCIFYEMGLHLVDGEGNPVTEKGKNFNARGLTFPGHPFVIIGHNARIAWGVAHTGVDNQDLYVERINPLNPNQYEVNGEWVDMEIIYERIEIEGESEPYILRVRKTRHGPIISDRGSYAAMTSFFLAPDIDFPDNLEFTAISLKWTALEPWPIISSFRLLNQADNFQDFRNAMRVWSTPSVSLVYADVDGNIGYYCPPPVPIRKKGEGRLPSPGWTDDYEWEGYIPFEELPYSYNPPKGYIVACNNPPVSENYPYFIGSSSSLGFRARRAVELIEADEDGITVEEVKAWQADAVDAGALEIIPYLEGLDLSQKDWLELEKLEERMEDETEKEREEREEKEAEELEAFEEGRKRLLEWDGSMDIESAEAALFAYFWQRLMEQTFKDQYPEARWSAFSVERALNSFDVLLPDPQNFWWDDIRSPDVQETRDDIFIRAFRKAYRDAEKELGDNMDKWEWGEIHQIEFREQTMGESGIKFVEKLFNRGPVPTRGGEETLSIGPWRIREPFDQSWLAASRMVVDLSEIGSSYMMIVPGQSGHPKHKHYDDFIEPWRMVEYHPTLFHREDIKGGSILTLKPAGD